MKPVNLFQNLNGRDINVHEFGVCLKKGFREDLLTLPVSNRQGIFLPIFRTKNIADEQKICYNKNK